MALTDNLRAYYKFNEVSGTSAADATGNGYTGTLDTYTFNSGGKIGYCVSGGSTGYGVSCGQVLSLSALSPMSISGWYNFTQYNTYQVLWGKVGTNTNIYSFIDNAGVLTYVFAKTTAVENVITYTGLNTAIGTNNWKMITFTNNGNGDVSGMKLYINGVEYTTGRSIIANSLGSNDPDNDGTASFRIGSYSPSNAYQTQGKIDEFGVWHKELSTTEITTLYNNGYGLSYPFTGKTVRTLVVGGGGGAGRILSGGAGAGGLITTNLNVEFSGYTVTVGNGGAGGVGTDGTQTLPTNGGDSIFSTITAYGGGASGYYQTGVEYSGKTGGCGGAGGAGEEPTTGGAGSQGGNGGTATSTVNYIGAGGGGAGANGGDGSGTTPGNGGNGLQNDISGTNIYYAGGGGGCRYSDTAPQSSGGLGGGGKGNLNNSGLGENGTNGLGGGAGGCPYNGAVGSAAPSGGSGVVIIRYLTTDFGTCTGGTITTSGSDTIHTFTTSGTMTFVQGATVNNGYGFFMLM